MLATCAFGILDGFVVIRVCHYLDDFPGGRTGLIHRSGDGIVTQPAHRGHEHRLDPGGHGGVLDRGVAR